MPRRLLNRLAHFIVAIEIKYIRHQVQRILIILHFSIQSRQVKPIREVIFVDFAKVLIAAGRDELLTKRQVSTYTQYKCKQKFRRDEDSRSSWVIWDEWRGRVEGKNYVPSLASSSCSRYQTR